jgi:hypothetical protein
MAPEEQFQPQYDVFGGELKYLSSTSVKLFWFNASSSNSVEIKSDCMALADRECFIERSCHFSWKHLCMCLLRFDFVVPLYSQFSHIYLIPKCFEVV